MTSDLLDHPPRTFSLAKIAPQRWRNGGGLTREILVLPCADGRDWDCRVSVADIEHDGPFSTFDGIDRTAVLLEGPGLLLQGAAAGESVRFEHVAAVNRFAGETPLVARLPGTSARLFNVMHRRSAFVAQADAHRADGGKLLDRDCTTVVLAYAGRFDLSFEGETDGRLAITLSSGSGMVVFDRRASLDWRPRQENGLLIIVTLARG